MLSMELGNQVDSLDVRAYLEARGWISVPSRSPYAAIYRSHGDCFAEVQVPLDRNLADYGEAIGVIAQRLAAYERRSAESVLDELLMLRASRESQPDQFVGTVVELMGGPGDRGEVEGTVVLQVQVDDELLKARVTLGPVDYRKAARAHLEQRYVTVRGILRRGPRVNWVDQASGFEIVGSQP
ncbi:hypothetical protein ACLESO_10430 [Pyxidicoccus sp. 3LG]